MSTPESNVFKGIYGRAKKPEDLPWNHAVPTLLLPGITETHQKPGKALDIGCGSGIDSIFLAKQGWEVTSLDFMQEALEMTRKRAAEAGVTLEFVQADVTSWSRSEPFDIILDAGVLHNMKPVRYPAYRERILSWLTQDGDFLLHHHEKRHALDWRPIGPRRVSPANIRKFFAPELTQKDYTRRVTNGVPLPVGPSIAAAHYWFRRS